MPLKEFWYRWLNALYELIFKEKMDRETLQFFTGTSYVAIGTLIGMVLTFIFNVLGARILGPTNFGTLALVMTVAGFLSVTMGIGLSGTLKYGSEEPDDSVRARIISTYVLIMVLLTVASVVIYVLFSAQLSAVFGISIEVYLFAVAFAAIVVFFGFSVTTLRILFRIREYALYTTLQSVIVLAAFLILISTGGKSWQAAIFAILISDATIVVIVIVRIRQYIKLQFDRPWAKRIMTYTLYAYPGGLAGALMYVDRVLINKFVTTADVGIYSAYYLPSLIISSTLWGIFNAAFFPYASKSRDKLSIFHKVNKAVPFLVAALVPLFVVTELIIFTFYGRQYPFSVELGLVFAFAATVYFFYLCYSFLTASEGTSGAKINTFSSFIALALLIGLDVLLIPLFGIIGAAVALVGAYLIAAVYLVSRSHILEGGEKMQGEEASARV